MQPPAIRIFLFLIALSLMSILLSLAVGSNDIGFAKLWAILLQNHQGVETQIVLDLRWPRTATAFLAGGLLGLAGVLMQALLRNPLADPYILGISGGAATGALLSISLGISSQWLESSAFAGALLSMVLVYVLSQTGNRDSHFHLLLTGVVLAAGWGAVINLLLILSQAQNTHSMLFWLMGDLATTSMPNWHVPTLLIAGLIASWLIARDLNLLIYGEQKAQTLGSNVKLTRRLTFVIAALATAVAVSIAGTIGFIGLIIPHLVRLVLGSNHRIVLPASVLAGGSLLVLADVGARTLLAPQQLPVGVITAFIGVPVFLYLLKKRGDR